MGTLEKSCAICLSESPLVSFIIKIQKKPQSKLNIAHTMNTQPPKFSNKVGARREAATVRVRLIATPIDRPFSVMISV